MFNQEMITTEDKQKFTIKKIGKYLLIKEVGRGSFSTVFKSKIEKTYEKVAIKVMPIMQSNWDTI